MKLPISRLNHIIELGTVSTVPSRTLGGSRQKFMPTQTLHCAIYQRSQSQQYALVGTALADTTVVAVRSQHHVDKQLKVRFKGDSTIYDILTISRDESHTTTRYDLLTLKDTKKAGATNG